MSVTREESYILQKIVSFSKELHEYFEEIGLSRRQIALFFARRIFSVDIGSIEQTEESGNMLKTHLKGWLKIGEQKYGSLKAALTNILLRLQMEKGAMEEYEKFEPPAEPKAVRRYEVFEPSKEEYRQASRRLVGNFSFKDHCEEIGQREKIMTDLKQIRNFEKELSDSMRKTQLLKKMIQQKMMEEVEESYSQSIRRLQQSLKALV